MREVRRNRLKGCWAVALSCLVAQGAQAMDCRKVATPQERLICLDSELQTLDTMMNGVWGQLMPLATDSRKNELKSEQKEWLKARNQVCLEVLSCFEVYAKRIAALKKEANPLLMAQALESYKTMNEWVWDPHFRAEVLMFFAGHQAVLLDSKPSLTGFQVIEVLNGPPEALDRSNGIVVGAACRSHSCPEKGVVAYDTQSRGFVFGVLHYFGKNGEEVPQGVLTLYYKEPKLLAATEELLKRRMEKMFHFSYYETERLH